MQSLFSNTIPNPNTTKKKRENIYYNHHNYDNISC